MRPSVGLLIVFLVFVLLFGSLYPLIRNERNRQAEAFSRLQDVVYRLALSDLAISTEARYTRHPAVSDRAVVTMDHPGAIDHFPSTLFWAPVR